MALPRLSSRPLRRYLFTVFVFAVLFLLIRPFYVPSSTGVDPVVPGSHALPPNSACSADLEYLRREQYGLTAEVVYQKRCIRALLNDEVDRYTVENLTEPLVQTGDILQKRGDCRGWTVPTNHNLTCRSHLEVAVPPAFPRQDYGHFLFGVATTFQRLNQSLPQFSHWLSHSGATLVAMMVDAKEMGSKVDDLISKYRAQDINIILESPEDPSVTINKQHFAIILNLKRHITPGTKWVSIIDDDTFFPSLFSLSNTLRQYDPKTPVYLGGMSESVSAVESHGILAYGGAGVFLSVPLITEIYPFIHECLEENKDKKGEKKVKHGDKVLSNCIRTKTRTDFTVVPGLRQLDLHGDISGFYESGQLPISLHHWKSWHNAPVDKMAKVSDFCGGCFLQRWRLDGDTILTNGFSIAVYQSQKGTEDIPLDRIEGTWDGADNGQWRLGPMRPALDGSQKKSYLLLDSERVGSSLRQLYVHRDEAARGGWNKYGRNSNEHRDEIIELWWEWQTTY